MIDAAQVKLGKLPPRTDPRTLRLARYVKNAALDRAPAKGTWAPAFDALGVPWQMLGNSQYGDCTCAALGHQDQTWDANGGHAQHISESDVLALYWATGTADTGRDMLSVLNKVREIGLGGDKPVAFAALEPMNYPPRTDKGESALMKYAINVFGGAYLGLWLPLTAQGKSEWDYVPHTNGNEPGSWGGHAVNAIAWDRHGYSIVTWGGIVKVTWRFHYRYCDEAYAIISEDWLNAQAKTPQGFDMARLQADLAAITG